MFKMSKRNRLRQRVREVFGIAVKQEAPRWDRIILLSLFSVLLPLFSITGLSKPQTHTYQVTMDEASKVYDGDTIQDVFIEVRHFENLQETDNEVLWPGLLLKDDKLYVVTDVRLNGIDTPEKRPLKKGRTPESLAKEKAAASRAQKALLKLVEAHENAFSIENPKIGKYAGRIVADVYFGEGDARINASTYMIEKGHAKPYDGGRKPQWDW